MWCVIWRSCCKAGWPWDSAVTAPPPRGSLNTVHMQNVWICSSSRTGSLYTASPYSWHSWHSVTGDLCPTSDLALCSCYYLSPLNIEVILNVLFVALSWTYFRFGFLVGQQMLDHCGLQETVTRMFHYLIIYGANNWATNRENKTQLSCSCCSVKYFDKESTAYFSPSTSLDQWHSTLSLWLPTKYKYLKTACKRAE